MDSSHPDSGPEPALINPGKLQTFVMLGGDDYRELLGDLIREVPEQLDRMRTAIAAGDVAECRQRAHSLRGILGYFGCVVMTARLGALESRDAVMPEEAATIHADFQDLWHNSLAAIREWEKSVPEFATGA